MEQPRRRRLSRRNQAGRGWERLSCVRPQADAGGAGCARSLEGALRGAGASERGDVRRVGCAVIDGAPLSARTTPAPSAPPLLSQGGEKSLACKRPASSPTPAALFLSLLHHPQQRFPLLSGGGVGRRPGVVWLDPASAVTLHQPLQRFSPPLHEEGSAEGRGWCGRPRRRCNARSRKTGQAPAEERPDNCSNISFSRL